MNAYKDCIELIERSFRRVEENVDSVNPLYPYGSIVYTATYVTNQLFRLDKDCKNKKDFLQRSNSISKWCKNLIETAKRYDMVTEERYDTMREDDFYKQNQKHLISYLYTESEMEVKLDADIKGEDIPLMKDYLYVLDPHRTQWKDRTRKNLMRIKSCSEKVIFGGEYAEGIIWRWFYANAYLGNVDMLEARLFLKRLDPEENSLSVQFMQYVALAGNYLKNANETDAEEIRHHIERCRELNQNSDKTRTRLYYVGGDGIAFRKDKNENVRVEGKVSRWVGPQNGQIQFGAQYKLTAFFVPSVIGMPKEGAVGTEVTFILGASFDGFRAWNVEKGGDTHA